MSKNEKVTENKEQKEQTEQKVMTKYDRKVQKLSLIHISMFLNATGPSFSSRYAL